MALFTLTVIPDAGEPFTVPVASRDAAQWEKRYRGTVWSAFEASPDMTNIYRLGHIAAVRLGLFTGSVDDFQNGCDVAFVKGTESDDDGGDADPTRSAA